MMEKIKKIIPSKLFKTLQPAYHFILSFLASVFYFFPSNKLVVIGVTGTSGKTSTSYLVYKMLQQAGYKTGLTSTAVFSDGENEWLNDKKMTMPGRFFIQRMLNLMRKNECRYVVVETTSEGIKQFRHRFINYDVLVFTNLYPEHIESHGSFSKYKEAKGELFAHLSGCKKKYVNKDKKVIFPRNGLKKIDAERVKKTIIVNADDRHASYFLDFWSEAKIAYSLKGEKKIDDLEKSLSSESLVKDFSKIKGEILSLSASSTKVLINGNEIGLNILGDFNALNALAAYSVGISQGLGVDEIKMGLEKVKSLAGKLEKINAGQDFIALVDYSFEPKALESLYKTLDLFSYNRLIHVLGSTGGGRDKARRPVLGKLAGKKADIVIVTNEDPYDEDPDRIIKDVSVGAKEAGKIGGDNLFEISNRDDALKKAVKLAKKDDLLLVTGKGAEQYICIKGGRKIAWDDREELKKAIVENLCIDKK